MMTMVRKPAVKTWDCRSNYRIWGGYCSCAHSTSAASSCQDSLCTHL